MSSATSPSKTALLQPWRHFSCLSGSFLMKYSADDCGGYEAYFCRDSDLTCIWLDRLSSDDISSRLKELNPSVEAPAATIMTQISSILRDGQTGDINYELSSTSSLHEAELGMDIRLGGGTDFPKVHLKWVFKGKKASETVNVLVTMPLLSIASIMNAEIESLQRLITKKDVEIRDYRAQGGKVSRKHLETKQFDASEFKRELLEKLRSIKQSPAAAVFAAAHVLDLYADATRDLATMPVGGQGQSTRLHDLSAGSGATADGATGSSSCAGDSKPTCEIRSSAAAGGSLPGPEAELAEERRRREELQQRRRRHATSQPISEPAKKLRGKKALL